MTCHRVSMSPSLCTCGVVLDITQWHGDDELGNPLCPTCSGCGCEPNERNLMNEQQAERLKALMCRVEQAAYGNGIHLSLDDVNAVYYLLHAPVPEPDHSMCARLVPSPNPDGDRKWVLRTPSGFHCNVHTDESARSHGYAIPEPEPTVVERAARVIATTRHDDNAASGIAQALADAGLLVRDGEQ